MSSTRVGPDVSEDGEPTSGPSATKGPMLNGSAEAFLTPELLYKMNKKIAQLTKVVYGLNTRGEELECQLGVSKEAEEKTRALNNDLQHRVNTFKSKIENEMGKLRDLENQANQSQIWKLECENLQRRLDAAESSKMGGESFLAMAKARDEIDQYKRRESSLQYELDQARHAINSLKAHHDFIMRERTAQQAMENEKILLEWQTRCAELEARYKSQIRRLTDDREVLTSECDILRGRKSREKSSTEETILRDQVMALQMQYETDRREWEAKCRILKEDLDAEKTKHNRVKDELEDEGIKHSEERRELIRKLQHRGDDNKKDDMWEERIRNKTATLDERIKDLSEKNAILQSLLDDKEEEFELRLKTKVVEWKSEWELAEEELHKEIKKLKNENALIKSETNAKRFSSDGSGSVKRIKELEEELRYKSGEMNSKAKDFEVRLNTIENENARLRHEKLEWQKVLEGEKERAREKNKSHEIWDKNKEDFQNRLLTLKDTEKMLREANRIVEEENEVLKKEKEELNERIKIKEKEWQLKLENEVKNTETRITKKIERIWLEKLKLSEESSSYDVSLTIYCKLIKV